MAKETYLNVGGKDIKVQVASDVEAEESDLCVCVLKSTPANFDDDEFGICYICEREVRFRPYMPKKPKKICVQCLEKKLEEGDEL